MKAGFSRIDITPRIGVELYGFGPFSCRHSTAVRDILEARAGAFSAGGNTVLFITADLCVITADIVKLVRQTIRERHPEIAAGNITVTASHTHSGPAVGERNSGWGAPDPVWNAVLPYKLADAGCRALENMQEATVRQALVPCRHMGYNRIVQEDVPPLADVLKDDWEPDRPDLTDTVCRVVRFDDASGKLLGFMANFGCHPVVCSADNTYIHGDYPGVAMHHLMREFPGSVGLFLQGAHGDINSGCVHRKQQESLLALEVFAARFANAVREGLAKAEPVAAEKIESVAKVCSFAVRETFTLDVLEEIRAEQAAVLHRSDADDHADQVRLAAVLMRGAEKMKQDLAAHGSQPVEAELQIIRMGELEFFCAPFEVMQAIKNDVLANARGKYPMLLSLANGAYGYAPDNASLKKITKVTHFCGGNYEAVIVPLISARLPYGDIHNELVKHFSCLEKEF